MQRDTGEGQARSAPGEPDEERRVEHEVQPDRAEAGAPRGGGEVDRPPLLVRGEEGTLGRPEPGCRGRREPLSRSGGGAPGCVGAARAFRWSSEAEEAPSSGSAGGAFTLYTGLLGRGEEGAHAERPRHVRHQQQQPANGRYARLHGGTGDIGSEGGGWERRGGSGWRQ